MRFKSESDSFGTASVLKRLFMRLTMKFERLSHRGPEIVRCDMTFARANPRQHKLLDITKISGIEKFSGREIKKEL